MIKAILIDPDALRRDEEPIRTVEIEDCLGAFYEQLSYGRPGNERCETVEAVDLRQGGDFLYVDEEALLKSCPDLIMLEGHGVPMTGKGLVMGCGPQGEEISPQQVDEDWLRQRARIVIKGRVYQFEEGEWTSAAVWRYGDTGEEVLRRLARGLPADPLLGYDPAAIVVPPPDPFRRHNDMIDPMPDPRHLQRCAAIIDIIRPECDASYPAFEALVRTHVMDAVSRAISGDISDLARCSLVTDHFLMDQLKELHGEGTEVMAEKAAEVAAPLGIAPKIRILIELGCDDALILACFQPDRPEPT